MKHLLPLFILLAPAIAWAYTVSGRVVEKTTGENLPLATYHIFSERDTINPAVNDITDENGMFSTPLTNGKYHISVEYASKKTYMAPFTVAGEDLNLGILALEELGEELEEVTVVARKDLISSDGNKLTYDVERDPTSATNSILEMLRKVPMVTVDGEDNIKVKGNSNFKIYINGRPDPMLSGDPSTILKSMPAASIKKIEVITDPGAKYDAEGTAGILNIIMDRKQSIEGYNVNARAGISSSGANASLYGRTKVRNVTVSASWWGYLGNLWRPHYYSDTERTYSESDDNHLYTSHSRSLNKYKSTGGNINMSWEPDTLNLFTLSFYANDGNSRQNTDQTNRMADINGATSWSYNRDFNTYNNWYSLSGSLSYQHTFPGNSAHTLALTYQVDCSKSKYNAFQHSFDFFNMPADEQPYMSTRNIWTTADHTFQADYSLPVTDKQSLDIGAKALIRQPKADNGYFSGPTEATDITLSLYDLTQLNDLYAAYATYNASFGRFSARAGVRYEHSRMGMRYHNQVGTKYSDFTTNLNDIVPDASLTYKLDDMSNLRLAYSMRIQRPYTGQLSPAVNEMTYGDVSYGNPDLNSTHANNVSLKYSNYGGKFSGDLQVGYSQNNDMISNISFMKDGVLHSTYENIGKQRRFDLSGYLMYQITSDMDASIWVGTYYNDYKSDGGIVPIHSHGWDVNMNANYSYTMPCRIRLDAWGGYGSGSRSAQSRSEGWNYYGLSLSRSFLKDDALTLSVNASDILPARWISKNTQTTPTTVTKTSSNFRNWNVGMSVSFRFGSLRADVKRTRANINNNDSASGAQSGSGGKG